MKINVLLIVKKKVPLNGSFEDFLAALSPFMPLGEQNN